MTSVAEIEKAIHELALEEREELEIRLYGPSVSNSLSDENRTDLLAARKG